MSAWPEMLAAHLAREVTTVCHCWRLTRTDGWVAGFTDHDRPLIVGATPGYAPQTGSPPARRATRLAWRSGYGGCRGRPVFR